MATYTPNYNLKKPDTTDLVSIADINGNMDTLDTTIKSVSDNQVNNGKNTSVAPSAAIENGFYYVTSSTSGLSGADANPFRQYHTSNNDFRILTTAYSDLWIQQIATDFRTDNIFIRRKQNGTWSDWVKLATNTTTSISIATGDWSSKTATKTVTGVTASNTVIVSPAPASITAWGDAGIKCTAQAANSLTFTCEEVPTSAISVNVVILG